MDFFKRDIVILLAVSIFLGTMAAKGLSYGANLYFQETLTQLVGDYGEYDLLLQMREDAKEEGQLALDKVLGETFSGASVKAGPDIIGKANFFIALPQEKKNQAVYENLDRLFAGVPGVSGISVLTEPRLNIRGIPAGAAGMLEEELRSLEGVDFVYRGGGSIGIVLKGTERIETVTRRTESALKKNKIIDVSFPVGADPENPVLLAERISGELYRRLRLQTAQYVSVDTGNDDMAHLISTMQEVRRFLTTYASRARISPLPKITLAPGDRLVFQGSEDKAPAPGETLRRGNVVVMVTRLARGGQLEGVIVQGDAADFSATDGFLLEEQQIKKPAGTAAVENPRVLLVKALRESADFSEKIPQLAAESRQISGKVRLALGDYAAGAEKLQGAVERMDEAAATMENAARRLENANIEGLKRQLDQAALSVRSLLGALRLIRVFHPDVAGVMQSLESTEAKMRGVGDLLGGMEGIAAEASQARWNLARLALDGKAALEAMRSFQGSKAQADLEEMDRRFQALATEDFKKMARELRRLADEAPHLTDEEIYSSVQLMDKVIEGQIIPGKRLQIMVDRNLSLEQAKPIIYEILGHENAGVYETDLGVIEPNLYLQFYQVLKEVQAVLAGLASLALTIVFLALDHTAVMSALRSRRLRQRRRSATALRPLPARIWRWTAGIYHAENLYGMTVGAVLLSAMFFLSGGGIPYVNWPAVPLAGAAVGFGMARLTDKITPIAWEEVLAGQSLGMSFDEVMREIVIPSARPGLLQRLNRRRQYFD